MYARVLAALILGLEPTTAPTSSEPSIAPSPVPTLAFDELSYSYIYDTIAPTPLPTDEPSPRE